MITILAIAPAIPVIALVVALGGVFAFMKKKPSAPSGGQPLPPAPTPDPGTPAPAFLNLKSGTTTAVLERAGDGLYKWSLAGASTDSGTHENAGRAAVDMASALAEATEGQPITGSAGGGGSPRVDFSVQPEDERWSWIVTGAGPQIAGAATTIGSGEESSRGSAMLQTLASASSVVQWLGHVPGKEGGEIPVPTPDPAQVLPGIKVVANMLAITNAAAWVAYAQPLVREDLEERKTADEMMDEMLGRDLPDNAKVNGQTVAAARTRLQQVLDSIYDGTYVDPVSPDRMVALLIVGGAPAKSDAKAQTYKGHVIVVRPTTGGPAGGIGVARQEWLVWDGAARGYDDEARETELTPPGTSQVNATKAAKAWVDMKTGSAMADPDYEPEIDAPILGATVVCPPGEILVDGKCERPKEIELVSPTQEFEIVAQSWTTGTAKSLSVFDFAIGSNRARMDWTLAIAVCITPKSDLPLGNLTTLLALNPSKNDVINHLMQKCAIKNVGDAPASSTVDWASLRSPLCFKAQLVAKFEQGVMVKALPGSPNAGGPVPSIVITKALTQTGNTPDDEIDPCPSKKHRWPKPKDPEGFLVRKVNDDLYTKWKPAPHFGIVTQGHRISFVTTIAGMPAFFGNDADDCSWANIFSTTYDVSVRVIATGINAPRPPGT